ncbi:MAG: dTMP kinase [Anaerolineae bacterium]|nr:dTMP kinase [Anaerolineae bacterium]
MFITFEGPEGSGKSTQIALLQEFLTEQGYTIQVTREPGGTRISEQIRDVLHDMSNRELTPRTEILLFSAARAQHCDERIRPALVRGEVVLCDRFFDSTYAYQGYGHRLDLAILKSITRFATDSLTPDLTLYIDVPAEEGIRRKQADKGLEWNRMDDYALEFHQRVEAGYRALIADEPQRWAVVDGARSIEAVWLDIRGIVMARLDRH